MSYILEALKKAEQQRELGRVPGIETIHEQAQGGTFGRWLWGVALVLALNATVLLVLFWPEQRHEMRAAPSAPPTPLDSFEHDSGPTLLPPAAAVDLDPVPSRDPAPAVEAVDTPIKPQSARAWAGAPDVPPPAETQPALLRRPAQPAPSPPKPAGADAALPVWPRIPDYLFQQLGTGLRMDVHVHASRPQERFVLINLRKYQEGDQLQEGPRLEAITREGAILSFQGERFRVQAQ